MTNTTFEWRTATTYLGHEVHAALTSTFERTDGSVNTDHRIICGIGHRYQPRVSEPLERSTMAEQVTCERCIERLLKAERLSA